MFASICVQFLWTQFVSNTFRLAFVTQICIPFNDGQIQCVLYVNKIVMPLQTFPEREDFSLYDAGTMREWHMSRERNPRDQKRCATAQATQRRWRLFDYVQTIILT